ncbi:MAG: H4MPT-linked C1 transfer pathway protein [Gemmataceae bacterium]|nr:H4MPT-linked C1 transfer pathway protein [Gemmataceae bacterium]
MSVQGIGLDIGGANLKVATSSGLAMSRRFELWKHPHQLAAELANLGEQFTGSGLIGITMTGELCDCFPTKRDGVRYILAAVASVFPEQCTRVWSSAGSFVFLNEALAAPLAVASANWHAQATFVGRGQPANTCLLIDTGSTTTDIIPIHNGKPVPRGLTDPERLKSKELVYTGVRRTPICALFNEGVAAEFFATTQDAYILLGMIAENASDKATSDGRAATKTFAHSRLSRMLAGDSAITLTEETLTLARNTFAVQIKMILGAVREVASRLPRPLETIVVSGSGEFLARAVAEQFAAGVDPPPNIVSLSEKLGPAISEAACAYALSVLLAENPP